jgi:hypothetical protein
VPITTGLAALVASRGRDDADRASVAIA